MTFLQPYLVLRRKLRILLVRADSAALMAQLLKQRQLSWHEIVAGLQHLNTDELSAIAIEYLVPHSGQITLEPEAIWESLGGYQGLRKMRENAQVYAGSSCLRAAVELYRSGHRDRTHEDGCGSTAPSSAPRGVGTDSLLPVAALPVYPPPARPGGDVSLLPDAPAPALPLSNQSCGSLSASWRKLCREFSRPSAAPKYSFRCRMRFLAYRIFNIGVRLSGSRRWSPHRHQEEKCSKDFVILFCAETL
jgi:hypothetical protein